MSKVSVARTAKILKDFGNTLWIYNVYNLTAIICSWAGSLDASVLMKIYRRLKTVQSNAYQNLVLRKGSESAKSFLRKLFRTRPREDSVLRRLQF